MPDPKPTLKHKAENPTKKSGLPLTFLFVLLAIGIGFLATQIKDPSPLTALTTVTIQNTLQNTLPTVKANFRRWNVDREILRQAEQMGGRVYSYDPLVIYVPNFINKSDISYLAEMGEKFGSDSTLTNADDDEHIDLDTRKSKSALLPFSDPVVRALAEKSQVFQGYNDISHLESLQVVTYGPSDHFWHHYDYHIGIEMTEANGYNRDTTILVYLEDDCTAGGTNFPNLPLPEEEKMHLWADALDLNETEFEGPTFKPVAGAAIFWRNLDATGKGLKTVMHAGLPVKTGHKSAVNIWTEQGPVKGDSWFGLTCMNTTGELYDCEWDDPEARPGLPVEYSGNYWIEEGRAYRRMMEKVDEWSKQLEEGAEGELKTNLTNKIKKIKDTLDESQKFLESVLQSSSKQQLELVDLIKEVEQMRNNTK